MAATPSLAVLPPSQLTWAQLRKGGDLQLWVPPDDPPFDEEMRNLFFRTLRRVVRCPLPPSKVSRDAVIMRLNVDAYRRFRRLQDDQ
jgi:hypothetical protein